MKRVILCLLVALFLLPTSGCSVTVGGGDTGKVLEDGSVYLGWTLISRKKGKDFMLIGEEYGAFASIRFQVTGRPLHVRQLVVTFGNGEKWSPPLKPEFHKGEWTREIALPGKRHIRKITFFGHARGKKGRMAKVEVYGRR